METLHTNFTELLEERDPPCLSLYQPTHRHHPDNQQDATRYTNLVKTLESSLREQYPAHAIASILERFRALASDRDFWNHAADGLAVLGAKDFFRVFRLQRPVPELVIVADSFHVKPLMRILQSADRYQVLALNRKRISLFEGNRDSLDEIDLAPDVPRTLVDALGEELTEPHLTVSSYGGAGGGQAPMHHGHGGRKSQVDIDAERFFRVIDRAVLDHHSRPSGLPLILAALPEHHHLFHRVSQNPFLVAQSLDIHPDAMASTDDLRQRAWKLMEPRYLERLASLVEDFGSSFADGRSDADLASVARAVAAGRVATMLIEADREIPGRIDPATGNLEFGELADARVDDVLDDLGTLTLKQGGEVVIVPADRMPTRTGVAAIYRY